MRTAGKGWLIAGLIGALLVAMALSVGCGGGGDKVDTSGGKNNATASTDKGEATASAESTPSKSSDSGSKTAKNADDYTSQVCKALGKYASDFEELSNGPSDVEDAAALKDYIDQMIPMLKGMSKDLDKITPPSEVADFHDGMVAGTAQAADVMSQMSDALDKPLDEALTEITDLSSQMDSNPLGTMGDLPDEYQQAFKDNPDCQQLNDLGVFE